MPLDRKQLGAFLRLKGVTKFLPFLRSDGARMVTEQQRGFVLAKLELMFAETTRAFCAAQPVFWGIEPACLAFARISQVRSAASAACQVVSVVRPPKLNVAR